MIPPVFKSRMRLRESDFEFFESPTDDTLQSFELDWGGEAGETSITLDQGDFEYVLTFRWFSTSFRDPVALDGTTDLETDGLTEALEARISAQDASLRPVGKARVEGYDGLADPDFRELFVEVDASGADHRMPFEAKQLVASRYHYRDIAPRFDDGYLGNDNNGIVPYQEIIPFSELGTFRSNHMWNERRSHYRYLLFVDKMEDEFLGIGHNGRADRPGTKFMVSRTSMLGDFSAIVTIHEMGHTLGLCHPIGTTEPPSPSPTCPTPSDWVADQVHCIHYCGVGEDDITAMGDDIDFGIGGAIGGAATGVGAGVLIGAGDRQHLRWWAGGRDRRGHRRRYRRWRCRRHPGLRCLCPGDRLPSQRMGGPVLQGLPMNRTGCSQTSMATQADRLSTECRGSGGIDGERASWVGAALVLLMDVQLAPWKVG